ncbi:uncharacterized protein C8R40DRAFT_1068933 [Lentinula edodes]|uniref:uncharacterized protein n=1 Tax=Lentinula edodes TaxID=5353 RepID=UPI001E8D73D1|nr:uncharacterized protein C8R40DRAFT_1068933 [Lentinula edodes]KAH7876149.1 hypothetical protein C8R40DRAFT_1068933 [Lentinula edodes]
MPEIDLRSEVDSEDTNDLQNDVMPINSFENLDFSARDTLYDQVEQIVNEHIETITPIAIAMQFYNNIFSKSQIPEPSTISIQRVPSMGDRGGLWLVDPSRNVITIAVVAQISSYADDLKCGEYLDMSIYNQEISLDSFRRASARLFFNEVYTPQDSTEEIKLIYQSHSTRFQTLLNCLQAITSNYLDSVKAMDKLHDLGHYGLQGKTANIFQNVPSRKTRQSSSMMNVRGQLPDPRKLRKAEKQQNLRALETNVVVNAVPVTQRVLGHWPDSEGFIRSLAEKHDLSSVQMHIPEVYDAQGVLIHPMDYENVLTCGRIVQVEFNFHIWDITKAANGKAINKPNRICSNIIRKIAVLPDDEDDIRVMFHSEAVKRSNELERQAAEKHIAEEARELARREEVLRLEQTMAKAKIVAETKKKRLEELRQQTVKPLTSPTLRKRNSSESLGTGKAVKRVRFDTETPEEFEEGQVNEDILNLRLKNELEKKSNKDAGVVHFSRVELIELISNARQTTFLGQKTAKHILENSIGGALHIHFSRVRKMMTFVKFT